MSGRAPGESFWRVSAKGTDAAVRDASDAHWGRAEALAAHRWVETAAPGSGFGVTRLGRDGAGDDVEATLTVRAADADAARAAATALLAGALPSVTWSRIEIIPDRAGRGSRPSEG
ncbi:MAG TPA: hypothetical protein VFW14_12885 [Gaiellales bacterium]|nr:hypothetical protein [Gaiellales bacterium]